MNLTNPNFTKVIITLLMTIGSLSAGLSQTWHESQDACDNNCVGSQCTKYYFDIDGDSYGVDDPGTNKWFCGTPTNDVSASYKLDAGDLWPFDAQKNIVALTSGCTEPVACNYDGNATVNDGSCVFPKGCQTCDGVNVVVSEYDATLDYTSSAVLANLSPCDCGEVDNVIKYLDAVGNCLEFGHAIFCTGDSDGDGICDLGPDGQQADPCTGSATEIRDDCGNCVESGAASARFFYKDELDAQGDMGSIVDDLGNIIDLTPCEPGDDNCMDRDGRCNCEQADMIVNVCGKCGEPDPAEDGLDCDGNLICVDTNPANGICDDEEVFVCTDILACNYTAPSASVVIDQTLCKYVDVCNVCGGSGIPPGACENTDDPAVCFTYPEEYYDCNGPLNDTNSNGIADELDITGCTDENACNFDSNADLSTECYILDALNHCYAAADVNRCDADADSDGICDDDGNDTCIGALDECGNCNGPGILADECDCDGNVADFIGVCGGNCVKDEDSDQICDLDQDGNVVDTFICIGDADAAGVCNGDCVTDADGDGICDDNGNDPCVGVIDVCGICDGTGIPIGDCDCEGNQFDELGNCGGACQQDVDLDGICDDNGNDPCVGGLDECGTCNGTGIPVGACDCNGNVLDAVSECGGNCLLDEDEDGICDLDALGNALDTCVGQLDECGVCDGSGPLPCGCEPIQNGFCDCNGNRLDECGVCGGSGPLPGRDCDDICLSDIDGDGICDFEDPEKFDRTYTYEEYENNKTILDNPPIDTKDAYKHLVSLHERMNLNLNEGSPTGTSNHLTVQESLTSLGRLDVTDGTSFESDVVVNGFLQIDYDANILGDVTVEGVQFSNGGIQTTSIDNSGSMSVGGLLNVGTNVTIEDEAYLAQTGIGGDFYIHNGLNVSNEISNGIEDVNFSVVSTSGNVRTSGSWDSDAAIDIAGKGTLNRMNVDDRSDFSRLTMDGSLDLNSSADFEQYLRVNGDKFTVEPVSGTTRIAGNLEVGAHTNIGGLAHLQGNFTVEGTFFANGGVLTTSVDMQGDLSVGQDTNFGKDFEAVGTTTAGGGLNAGKNFSVYNGGDTETANFNISNAKETVKVESSFHGVNLKSRSNAHFKKTLAGTTNLDVAGKTTAGNMSIDGTVSLYGSSVVKIHGSGRTASLTLQGDLTTKGQASLGALNNSGSLSTNGGVTMNGGLSVIGKDDGVGNSIASFTNTSSSGHGIKVKLGNSNPGSSNNYVEFQTSAGTPLGRIRGEKVSELHLNAFYKADEADMQNTVNAAGLEATIADVALGAAIANQTIAVAEVVAAAVSFTGCVGFGFCATMPIISFIAGAAINVVTAAVGLADAIIADNDSHQNKSEALSLQSDFNLAATDGDRVPVGSEKIGVTYESGAADYAEWMPKKRKSADYEPGQIVGVHEGQISLNTKNADHLFVISTQPIVLGNTPLENQEHYEMCAFMGQVPTNVYGRADAGDYIIASGRNDGLGVAINPSSIEPMHLKNIVGVAWEQGLSADINRINVAVGLNDAIDIVAGNLESRLTQVEADASALEDLIFSQLKGDAVSLYRAQQSGLVPKLVLPDYLLEDTPDLTDPEAWNMPNTDDYVVHEITPELMEYAWPKALKAMKAYGIKSKQSPTLMKLKKDDAYRAQFLENVRQMINEHNQAAVAQLDELAQKDVFKVVSGSSFMYSETTRSQSKNDSPKKNKRK